MERHIGLAGLQIHEIVRRNSALYIYESLRSLISPFRGGKFELSTSLREKAEFFRDLHIRRKKILILPNAWDVASARLFEDEGFPVVATSSAGMLVSIGFADGEEIGRDRFFTIVQNIANALTVPLSADSMAGFGDTPSEVEETAKIVIKSGAVGINIEDFDHSTHTLVSPERQIEKLKAIMRVSASKNVPLVINARTDSFLHARGTEEDRFNETVRRCIMYRDAGVDCVYPMGLSSKEHISRFVNALDFFPTNVMIRIGVPQISELEVLGVARVSFGPAASYATMGLLKRVSKELTTNGTYSLLVDGAISYNELNSLARKKE